MVFFFYKKKKKRMGRQMHTLHDFFCITRLNSPRALKTIKASSFCYFFFSPTTIFINKLYLYKMPMVKNLEDVHQQLMDIARECNSLSYRRYTATDLEKLQDKLRDIDSQYSEGAFGVNVVDRYEQEGQAQVANELEKVHKNIRSMLSRIDQE
jgi:hypothetical protein